MTEIMPVPRNLILLSYQQGGSGPRFRFIAKKSSVLKERSLKNTRYGPSVIIGSGKTQ